MTEIKGKFQIALVIKEYVDTGENIQLQPTADYAESCWNWDGVKETVAFFLKRIEEKLKDEREKKLLS